ncbi:MAG: response regulator [Euryarchaeota archaeon]|nr:response regulator [Euryarchaeota archaeon]
MVGVLYIEDNEDDILLMKMSLRGFGEVVGARSWEEARRLLAERRFDVVLLDYNLPGEDGLEVLNDILNSHRIPVIMVTGQGDEETATRAMKLGASDYIVKSVSSFSKIRKVIEDALERHRLEEEKRRLEEEIRRTNAELEKSNKFKDLLIDILHHDLMNPAGLAMSFAELIESSCDDSEVLEYVEIIKRNLAKIISLIEDVKELSKLENIRTLEKSRIKLTELWEKVLEEYSSLIGDREVSFIRDSDGSLVGNVILKEVLSNLLSNALKYSEEGTPITIRVWEEGGYTFTSIADLGEGVPDEYKQSIFNRFTRFDKAGVKGTGIGLAIVKRIVELHCGEVWVEDNSPRGAVFVVKLPKLPGEQS